MTPDDNDIASKAQVPTPMIGTTSWKSFASDRIFSDATFAIP